MHKNTSLLNCKPRCIGLGRVGSKILGWVELGQSADGLGWIGSHKMDPWTTLVHPIDARTLYVHNHSLTTGRQTDTGKTLHNSPTGQSNFIKAASPARTINPAYSPGGVNVLAHQRTDTVRPPRSLPDDQPTNRHTRAKYYTTVQPTCVCRR